MSEIKESSINVLYQEMLMSLKGDPCEHKWLTSNCNTQTSLSKIERKSVGIIPMTLNTFKKYADNLITGGFEEVNRLRLEIKKKSSQIKPSKIKTLKSNITDYKTRLDESERARAILIRAYNELNGICLDAISRSPEFQYDYRRHLSLYSKYFGLTVQEIDG